jgi:hypothetical protein
MKTDISSPAKPSAAKPLKVFLKQAMALIEHQKQAKKRFFLVIVLSF